MKILPVDFLPPCPRAARRARAAAAAAFDAGLASGGGVGGAAGTSIGAWQVGQLIWCPLHCESQRIPALQLGQEKVNSAISHRLLFVSVFRLLSAYRVVLSDSGLTLCMRIRQANAQFCFLFLKEELGSSLKPNGTGTNVEG
jgi:hypothetical protein